MNKLTDIRHVVKELEDFDVGNCRTAEEAKRGIIGYLLGRYGVTAKPAHSAPAYWQWTGAEYVCSVCGFRTPEAATVCPVCERPHAMPTPQTYCEYEIRTGGTA